MPRANLSFDKPSLDVPRGNYSGNNGLAECFGETKRRLTRVTVVILRLSFPTEPRYLYSERCTAVCTLFTTSSWRNSFRVNSSPGQSTPRTRATICCHRLSEGHLLALLSHSKLRSTSLFPAVFEFLSYSRALLPSILAMISSTTLFRRLPDSVKNFTRDQQTWTSRVHLQRSAST